MKRAAPAVLVILLAATVSAHGGEIPEAGTTPGSFFFAVEEIQESVSLIFTADKDKHDKKLQFAEERLTEAKKLGSENHSERALKALEMYNDEISEIEKERPELVNESSDEHLEVLEGLSDMLPESAHKNIQKSMKMSGHAEESSHSTSGNEKQHHGFMDTGSVVN